MYRVVGMMAGHLMRQKHWKSVAPSTSAASTMDWSTLPSAETYSTMGWPTEVVSRMRMMQPRAYFSCESFALLSHCAVLLSEVLRSSETFTTLSESYNLSLIHIS